ncbi:MAG: triphosphoribosyl-dephospho-CoA synthase MdcB [Herminiimonas sp.]|nr:triphosphoribosyl-dephospho-CoA synthase MdcB [Herminiimonas sp.]
MPHAGHHGNPFSLVPQRLRTSVRMPAQGQRALCRRVALLAVRSLHVELALYPKPGLVSRIDNGSHGDMNAATFLRSLFSLRHYFFRITQAGVDGSSFAILRQLGVDAERVMLRATGGINTHRGAIFCIGMLCAAIGRCHASGRALTPGTVRATLRQTWGPALLLHAHSLGAGSHGQQVALRHAVSGAGEEVALGLPAVFQHALPILRQTLSDGRSADCACIDALFCLMGQINDTNVYHRGGGAGAAIVKTRSQEFLRAGGTASVHWRERAMACHQLFIQLKLSPGGAADLLAATWFVHLATATSLSPDTVERSGR